MKWKSNRGFSFLELLSVLPVLAVLGTGVNSLLHRGRINPSEEEGLTIRIAQGRTVVDRMVQEIGQVGDTPIRSLAEGEMLPSSTLQPGAQGPFLITEPSRLVFEADVSNDGAKERVEYRLNGTTLERGVTTPRSDASRPEIEYEVLATDVENGSFPLFTYWGDPVGQAPRNGDLRSVRVLLLLKQRVPGSNRKEYKTVGYEGIAHIANHAVADSMTSLEPLDLQGSLNLALEPSSPLVYKPPVQPMARILGIMR